MTLVFTNVTEKSIGGCLLLKSRYLRKLLIESNRLYYIKYMYPIGSRVHHELNNHDKNQICEDM